MSVARFRTPGVPGACYVRPESILALSPAFAWSDSVDARTLYLTGNTTIIVSDTDQTIAAAVGAFATPQEVDDVLADERRIRRHP